MYGRTNERRRMMMVNGAVKRKWQMKKMTQIGASFRRLCQAAILFVHLCATHQFVHYHAQKLDPCLRNWFIHLYTSATATPAGLHDYKSPLISNGSFSLSFTLKRTLTIGCFFELFVRYSTRNMHLDEVVYLRPCLSLSNLLTSNSPAAAVQRTFLFEQSNFAAPSSI